MKAKVHGDILILRNTYYNMDYNLQFEKEKRKSHVSVLQLNKGNYGAMREELAKVQWNNTVEQKWQVFLGIMQKAQDRFISNRKKDPEGSKGWPWLMREVKGSIKIKEKKYNIAKMSWKPEDWEAFKKATEDNKKADCWQAFWGVGAGGERERERGRDVVSLAMERTPSGGPRPGGSARRGDKDRRAWLITSGGPALRVEDV
ncbi:uncharacterized protein LOC132402876 [Hypanus sabinus]|uniref:uncharacterized protein LOC132402876 n=1 Tax=Hypanus sabinus TaxID=79690 RepID=UPI0028C3B84C|nr:uncharacterized protein LOC132402876 [Hypanus sabinus]